MTPAQFAATAGVAAMDLANWIRRAPRIIGREVKPLGRLGTYSRYDWNDLSDLEREMRRRQQARAGAKAA